MRTVAFSTDAILVGEAGGLVSYTGFCGRNHAKARVAGREPPLIYGCVACPQGQRSLGGTSHACTDCESLRCVTGGAGGTHTATAVVNLNGTVQSGSSFLVAVEAFNARQRVERPQAIAYSQRVLLDTTPPFGGAVVDIVPCNDRSCVPEPTSDIDFSAPAGAVAAFWEGFEDDETAIQHYSYCVGSRQLACDVIAMTDAPPVSRSNESTAVNIELGANTTHGEVRCVSVEATSIVGLRSARVSSNCFITDETPPTTTVVRVGRDGRVHADEEMRGRTIFGSALGSEDYSIIDAAEWCISFNDSVTTAAPWSGNGSFYEWAAPLCDIAPLVLSQGGDLTSSSSFRDANGAQQIVQFGYEASLLGQHTIRIGARVRNALGLFGTWVWSNPTVIGVLETLSHIAQEEAQGDVSLVTDIVGYQASVDSCYPVGSCSEDIPYGSVLSNLLVDRSVGTVKYKELTVEPDGAVAQIPRGRRLSYNTESIYASSGSAIHPTTLAFNLTLGSSTELAQVYKTTYVPEVLLLDGDPAINDDALRRLLIPTLWAFDGSAWVEARSTCTQNASESFSYAEGYYEVNICNACAATSCSSGEVESSYLMTLQAAPTAEIFWANASCNASSTCVPAVSERYLPAGVAINWTSPAVLTRYVPAAISPPFSLALDGSRSQDYEGGSVVDFTWALTFD